MSNDSFTALIPFSASYTYEVHIYANKHLSSLMIFPKRKKLI